MGSSKNLNRALKGFNKAFESLFRALKGLIKVRKGLIRPLRALKISKALLNDLPRPLHGLLKAFKAFSCSTKPYHVALKLPG